MQQIRLFSKLLFSLMLGIAVAVTWFQFDERFIVMSNKAMEKVFENELNCRFRGQVKRLRPFSLTLEFENVTVAPFDAQKKWSWSAQNMTVHLSALNYFYNGAFGLHVNLKDLHSLSFIKNGMLAIHEHLLDLFAGANFSVPIAFQTITIFNGKLEANDAHDTVKLFCTWNSSAGKAGKTFKSKFYLSDTSLIVDGKELFKELKGPVTLDAMNHNQYMVMRIDASLVLPQLPMDQQQCYVVGTWNKNSGNFVLYNHDRTFSFVPIQIVLKNGNPLIKAEGVFLADYVKKLLFPFVSPSIGGMCAVKVSGNMCDVLQGSLRIHNLIYKNYSLDKISASFVRRSGSWHGVFAAHQQAIRVMGSWNWSEHTQQGKTTLTNRTAIPLFKHGYWRCIPRKTWLNIMWNANGAGTLEYATTVKHNKTEKERVSTGTISGNTQKVTFFGSLNDSNYKGSFLRDPFQITSFVYCDALQRNLIKITSDPADRSLITANLEYDCVQSILQEVYDITFPGYGNFQLKGKINYPKITGLLRLQKGAARPSGMYNFLSDMVSRVSIDLKKYRVIFHDTKLFLHQGVIKSKKSTILFDADGCLKFVHIPCQFYKCFLNWEKCLYAISSGAFVFSSHSTTQGLLEGFVTLEKSQFKENILALKTQKGLMDSIHASATEGYTVGLNMALSTQTPVLITTPELQTQAALDLTLTGSVRAPVLQGIVHLKGGKIFFPSQTLSVSEGKLTFLHGHSDDPLLELTAQARIKKYLITLTVGGSARDPEILLNAIPTLSEEQIIMLLLTGSEHESFNVMVPSLVVRNIETILFGSSNRLISTQSSFAPWLKPFEKIAFVPRFTDQTGRGGLKGALEIEVNPRLRAILEKNFSLSEDTSVEVEYLLSDEVSLKMSRDERGDIGAEVEMRFKF